jgi:hypothetical protein
MSTENQIENSENKLKKKSKWKIICVVILVLALIIKIIESGEEKDHRNKINTTQKVVTTKQIIVTENDREIYYKYYENYSNLPTVSIKDDSRHKEAISLTAKAFNKTDKEIEKIYEAVNAAKPTDQEIEIYETYDNELDKAIDEVTVKGGNVDEDAVKEKIAKQYNISTSKLEAIYILVLANEDYQNEQTKKIVADNEKKQSENLIKDRKEIINEYLSYINKSGMGSYINTVGYKTNDINDCSITVVVKNSWHVQNKQVRLQAAQTLWKIWTNLYTMADSKDDCHLSLVDLNDNSVGGSSWLGGSVVGVQD